MWEQLRLSYYQLRRKWLLHQQQVNVRRVHDLEQEIERLQSMPSNEGRSKTIDHLAKQLVDARR